MKRKSKAFGLLLALMTSFGISYCLPISAIAQEPDDRFWSSTGSIPGVDGDVRLMASHGDTLVVAGYFSVAGSKECENLALFDGQEWISFGQGGTYVEAMIFWDGVLIVAHGIGDKTVIEQWKEDRWQTLGDTLLGDVSSICVYDGYLVIGGRFSYGPPTSADIAHFGNGLQWGFISPNNGVWDQVRKVISFNGQLVALLYDNDSGTSALVSSTGGPNWQTILQDTFDLSDVAEVDDSLIVIRDTRDPSFNRRLSQLFRVSGDSMVAISRQYGDGLSRLTEWGNSIVAVNVGPVSHWFTSSRLVFFDQTSDSVVVPFEIEGFVWSLVTYRDKLTFAGSFTQLRSSDSLHQQLCAWNLASWDGNAVSPFCQGVAAKITDLALFQGEVIAAGIFTNSANGESYSLARWYNGEWKPHAGGFKDHSYRLFPYDNQLFLIGDIFGYWDGLVWHNLSDSLYGERDWTFVRNAIEYNGQLVLSGTFDSLGNLGGRNIATWNGSSFGSIGAPNAGGNQGYDFLNAVAVFGDRVMVHDREDWFAWDGDAWDTLLWNWSPGTNPEYYQSLPIIAWGDSLAYVLDDNESIGIWDGLLEDTIVINEWSTGAILRLCALGDTLLVAGDKIDPYPSDIKQSWHLVAIDDKGMYHLGSGVSGYGWVTALATDDSAVYVGGSFSRAGGKIAPGFAMWRNDIATDVPEDDNASLPRKLHVEQNYPNPFNPSTEIGYSLPTATHVTLEVYNLTGQRVATLVNSDQATGTHTVRWDASQYASGVYMYRLTAGEFTETKKMLLIK